MTIELLDAQAKHLEHPKTFEVPTPEELAEVGPGWFVKLGFKTQHAIVNYERMWVEVTVRGEGRLDNDPAVIEDLKYQDVIEYEDRHVLSIMPPRS